MGAPKFPAWGPPTAALQKMISVVSGAQGAGASTAV